MEEFNQEEIDNTIPELRGSIITLLQKNFELLIMQCNSSMEIQKKNDLAIQNNTKVERDLVFLQNMLQTQISETVKVILPLLKQDDLLSKQLKDKITPYVITDPGKRETINEIREYINEINTEDIANETPEQTEAREIEMFRNLIFETKKKKPQE